MFLLLCFCAAPAAAAPRPALLLPEGLVISSITIETHNVFETELPEEDKAAYRAANRIHRITREYVIMRELLFEVGDQYNADLAAETERLLRALPFIRRAEIEPVSNRDGTVTVTVRTYDAWSLELVGNYKRAGGATAIKAGLAEDNILGLGKSGSAVYSNSWGAASTDFKYKDRQFLNYKRMQYAMAARTAPGSQSLLLSLDRPFFASIARKATGASLNYAAAPDEGETRRRVEAGVYYGVSMAPSPRRTRRFTFGLLVRRAESTGPVPDRDRSLTLQLGAEWEELDFLMVRRIRKFTHDEDYNLGLGVFPTLGLAPAIRSLGAMETRFVPGIKLTKGFTWGDQLLFLDSGYSSSYANGYNSDIRTYLDASYFLRGLRYQTIALHTRADLAWRIDDDEQLTLGEFNGLRGYGVDQFKGSRRFLSNAEDRVFVWDELFRLIDIGAVFFFDSGYAWPAESPVRLRDLKNSVGLGLRAAPSVAAEYSAPKPILSRPKAESRSGTNSEIRKVWPKPEKRVRSTPEASTRGWAPMSPA
jgi:hypothetical protein